jgi:hypothetical protein
MNATLATVCQLVLIVFVPALLVVRFLNHNRIAWWTIVLLTPVLSWILNNLTLFFNQAHIEALIMQAGGFDRAPQALLDQWTNDGGPRIGAVLLGWVDGVVLLIPCLAIYGIAHVIRLLVARRR